MVTTYKSFHNGEVIAGVTAMKSLDRLSTFDMREKGKGADAIMVGHVTAAGLPPASALGILM